MTDAGDEFDAYELLAATSATLRDAANQLLDARDCVRVLNRDLMVLWIQAHGDVHPREIRRLQHRCGEVISVLDKAVTLAEDRLANVDASRAKLPIH